MEGSIGFSRAVRVGNIIAVAGTAPVGPDGQRWALMRSISRLNFESHHDLMGYLLDHFHKIKKIIVKRYYDILWYI